MEFQVKQKSPDKPLLYKIVTLSTCIKRKITADFYLLHCLASFGGLSYIIAPLNTEWELSWVFDSPLAV